MIRKPRNPKISVNPEKKTVAAILFPERGNLYTEYMDCKTSIGVVADRAMYEANNRTAPFGWGEEYKMVGVAKCMDVDTFSVDFGKELATAKADYRYHMQSAKCYERAISLLKKTVEHLEKLLAEHYLAAKDAYEVIGDATKN